MTDSAALKQALDRFAVALPMVERTNIDGGPAYVDDATVLVAAARCWLGFLENGPDYERADAAFRIALATKGIDTENLPTEAVSSAIVDAALARYKETHDGV